VFRELFELLDRHGDGRVLLFSIGNEFDGLSFWLWVLSELHEPSSLYEHLNCILQMDAVIGHVAMSFVELTILCLVDSLLLL